MNFIKLSLALIFFAIPYLGHAEKHGLPNNLNAQGQGTYSNLKWEFNILTESDLKNDKASCAVKIEQATNANSVVVSLTVGDLSDEIVIDDNWKNSSIDISTDYENMYTTEYLTKSRCLFEKSVALGTPRGIKNAITYTVNLSCPKGNKVQKILSCNFH